MIYFFYSSDGLKLGASEHWSKALEIITGETAVSADAILEYFAPLREVLVEETERLRQEDEVRQLLEKYNEDALPYRQNMVSADWNQTTDLNDPLKEAIYVKAVAENANFTKSQYETIFSQYKNQTFPDEKITRQINLIGQLETGALNDTQLKAFTQVVNNMLKIYNTATFCPYNNQDCAGDQRMSLEPGKFFFF